jgi:hypothetical protein
MSKNRMTKVRKGMKDLAALLPHDYVPAGLPEPEGTIKVVKEVEPVVAVEYPQFYTEEEEAVILASLPALAYNEQAGLLRTIAKSKIYRRKEIEKFPAMASIVATEQEIERLRKEKQAVVQTEMNSVRTTLLKVPTFRLTNGKPNETKLSVALAAVVKDNVEKWTADLNAQIRDAKAALGCISEDSSQILAEVHELNNQAKEYFAKADRLAPRKFEVHASR